MGCCQNSTNQIQPAIILPDQQMLIHRLELSHPFSKYSAEHLFVAFNSKDLDSFITESEFYQSCIQIQIDTQVFYSPKSPYSLYLYELKTYSFLRQRLILSAIMLSNSNWDSKLAYILVLFEINAIGIDQSSLKLVLSEMIDIAIKVTPSMSLLYQTKQSIDMYTLKILLIEPYLIQSILQAIGCNMTQNTLYLFFEKNPEYQKLFWCSGIRIMLIEEDTKRGMQDSKNFNQRQETKAMDASREQSLVESFTQEYTNKDKLHSQQHQD